MSRRRRSQRARSQRGQAMLEYSMLNWVLVLALVVGSTVRMIPSPVSGGARPMNVIEMFLWAYQTYYDSFYFVLNLPFP